MSGYFKQNLAQLSQSHPKLASRCEQDGSQKAVLSPNVQEASNWISAQQIVAPKVVFFMAIASGEHILQFIRGAADGVQLIVIIEKDLAIFNHFLDSQNLSDILSQSRIRFYVSVEAPLFKDIFHELFLSNRMLYYIRAIDVLPYEALINAAESGDYYYKAMDALKEGLTLRRRLATCDPHDTFTGLNNLIDNAKLVYESPNLDNLAKKFVNVPGIAIASGPSLDASMPYLKGITDKAIVMVVASLGKRFLELGINPQFIAAIERGYLPTTLFEGIKNPGNTRLLSPPLIDHQNYVNFGGGALSVLRQILLFEWFPSPFNNYFFGHTSATLAVFSLMQMGCNPIYLIGQDLAYQPGTHDSHATGIHQEKTKEYHTAIQDWEKVEVMGNNGQKVVSNFSWARVLDTFDLHFKYYPGQIINIIPENYGAKIAHTTRVDPEYAFTKLLIHPINNLNSQLDKQMKALPQDKQSYWKQQWSQLLPNTEAELSQIKEQCEKFKREIQQSGNIDAYLNFHDDLTIRNIPTNRLLADIIGPLDLDLFGAFYELPRKHLNAETLKQEQIRICLASCEDIITWSTKLIDRINLAIADTKLWSL